MFDIEAPAGEKLEPKFHDSLARYVTSFGVSVKVNWGFTDLLLSADIPILSNV